MKTLTAVSLFLSTSAIFATQMQFGHKAIHNKDVADGHVEPRAACEEEYGWYDGGSGMCYMFIMDNYDYQSYCYYDYNYYWGFSFFGAMECCYNNGGYLAEPKSEAEHNFLKEKMANYSGVGGEFEVFTTWWIGGQDMYVEDIWNWNSGGRIAYTNWGEGEPNNFDGWEDCIAMDSQKEFTWMDIACNTTEHVGVPHYVACQKPYAALKKPYAALKKQ